MTQSSPDRRLRAVRAAVEATEDPWQRLETFVREMIDMQIADAGLNDGLMRRFPEAAGLTKSCDLATQIGQEAFAVASEAGVVTSDFGLDDLRSLLWLSGLAASAANPPSTWRQVIERSLASARRPQTSELTQGDTH